MNIIRKCIPICFLLVALLVSGCGAGHVIIKPTPTPTPTFTLTLTPIPTSTPTPSDTPTVTPRPTPYGGATGKLLISSHGNLMLFDVGTGQSSKLLEQVTEFAWAPDGRHIAVIGQGVGLPQGLYLINSDDGSTKNVVLRTDVNSIVWSPDSSILAFQLSHAKNYFFQQEITLFYLDRANLLTLQTIRAENNFTQISVTDYLFLPDKSRIIFSARIGSSKKSDIYEIVPRWGTTPAPLAVIKSEFVNNLKLSPDGKHLAFMNCDEGNIYVLDLSSYVISKLTSLPLEQQTLCLMGLEWSPAGDSIVFTRAGTMYRINSDGTNLAVLMNNVTPDWWLAFSPDGKLFTFSSYRDNAEGVYTMNVDGTNVTRLTDGDRAEWQPMQK